jgi:hypothetical protein
MKLSKAQKVIMMQYVLDSIIPYEGTVVPCPVQWLVNTIVTEMGTTKQRQGSNCTSDYYYVAKLADHLQGLPSYLAIAFAYRDILQLPISKVLDLSTEGKQDEWLTQYWIELAHAIHNLRKLS